MRLMPFTNIAYQRVLETGYAYIIIEKAVEKRYSVLNDGKNLQMLKAVKTCDDLPEDITCEPVNSERIKGFLCDTQTDYFIILTGDK